MVPSNDNPKPATQSIALRAAILSLLATVVSCSDPKPTPTVGSNSNWLTACVASADCSNALGCNCGACSKGCSLDSDCVDFPGTACVLKADDASSALCSGSVNWASQGICLPRCAPGGCGQAQTCALGACVPLVLPSSDFCSPVSGASIDGRTREEELVLAAEQTRHDGGIDCGTGTITGALAFVRVDPRLTCAARVLAQDMAATGNHSLTDSAGRSTAARLGLAGYQQSTWAEGYAWDVTSGSAALQAMLKDSAFCNGFVSATLTDIGAGYSGNVYILTLAAE